MKQFEGGEEVEKNLWLNFSLHPQNFSGPSLVISVGAGEQIRLASVIPARLRGNHLQQQQAFAIYSQCLTWW